MFARLAIEADLEAYLDLTWQAVNESVRGKVGYSAEKVRQTFQRYLDKADPTIFVCEERRELIGFLNAGIYEYDFANGLFTAQQVIFVRPDKRGTRAAVTLVKMFTEWSDRLGALENTGGNDNGLFSESTARLLEHHGFERVGFFLRRVGGRDGGQKGR